MNMHPILFCAATGFSALLLAAAPAQARDNDHGWERGRYGDDRGRHNGWNRARREHGYYTHYRGDYYNRHVVVVPEVRRVYVNRYPAPVYVTQPVPVTRAVTCSYRDNTVPVLIGGAAGGVLGNQIGRGSGRVAATIAGALFGAALTDAYTTTDRYCTGTVFETAPVGQRVAWRNPQGYEYAVTPTNDYQTAGRYCREYQATATVGRKVQETYGTACMQPDGSWEVVN